MDTPQHTSGRTGHLRSKWAAIGAAVAVTLGAGGIGIARATVSSGPMAIYQAISPCRLADTRADSTVGPRNTALGANETYTLNGWNAVGNCTLPTGTSALQLNVTAVGATLPTFIAVFPAGGAVPTSSNLNPTPGAPPTPNSVTATLKADDGMFSVYNLQGSVNLIIDVVGYFEDHEHTGEDIVDNSISNIDTSNEAGVAFNYTNAAGQVALTGTPSVVASVSIRVPSNGYVTVTANLNWINLGAGFDIAQCQITKGTTINTSQPTFNLNDMDASVTLAFVSASSTRTLDVALADNPPAFFFGQSINLVCDELAGDVQIDSVDMQAQFVPTSYNPNPIIIIPFDEEAPAEEAPAEAAPAEAAPAE